MELDFGCDFVETALFSSNIPFKHLSLMYCINRSSESVVILVIY